MGHAAEHDTGANQCCALVTDAAKEKLIRAAVKKLHHCREIFPGTHFISNRVLRLKPFHFSASTKPGIREQYNYSALIIL